MLNHNIINTISVRVILAWVVRSSTDARVIPLRLSWQPNPFRSLRVALDTSCRVAVVVRTVRRFCLINLVASRSLRDMLYIRDVSGRYWPDALGVTHTATRAEPIRTEPIPTAWVVRRSMDATVIPLRLSWQPNPFRSLRVALDTSCRVAVVVRTGRLFGGITLVASRCLRDKH